MTASTRPPVVAWLGYGGLIPFVTLAVLTGVDRDRGALWHGYLHAYGAVILSFVGALHWAFAMLLGSIGARQRNAAYAWSVVPGLAAWVALIVPSPFGDALLAAGFVAQYWQDQRLTGAAALPAWYLPLRLQLSAVAVLSIASGAVTA